MKRIFKGPWLWIVVAVVGVLLALQYLAPNGGYDEIKTSQMIDYIHKGEVKEITFVDGDQQIKATLADGARSDGDKVTAFWLSGTQDNIEYAVQDQVDKGNTEEFNTEVPKPSLIGSILATLLPFALIILLFLFLMNQVQGGGGRGVMQFAKSKAKLIS